MQNNAHNRTHKCVNTGKQIFFAQTDMQKRVGHSD